jgi:hypothetical protein
MTILFGAGASGPSPTVVREEHMPQSRTITRRRTARRRLNKYPSGK